MLLERIKELCKKRGITVSELENRVGFGKNSIYKWKTQSPKIETLQKVAEYFEVSTDYLLGRTDNPTAGLSNKPQFTVEEALASVMSSDGKPLTEHDRKVLTGIIEAYIENNSDAE
ncbi:repressor protein [Enterococcus mundtii QU 25]|uniref:helix-turn-helix domain-containing protein n=1 Tax=Enterococcus mundtii TaxID=53346 RepID=UPI0003C56B59|nr:helix-turn-helix transcriptional regulator [Enterococcus mundtii]BAO08086.1 repressor protein [Enterococcus mundtii QU 25]